MEEHAFKEILVHVILPQLTPLDVINMTRVSHHCLSTITTKRCIFIINECIENTLKNRVFPHECDKIIQVIMKHDIMLSGKFIFNSICGLDTPLRTDVILTKTLGSNAIRDLESIGYGGSYRLEHWKPGNATIYRASDKSIHDCSWRPGKLHFPSLFDKSSWRINFSAARLDMQTFHQYHDENYVFIDDAGMTLTDDMMRKEFKPDCRLTKFVSVSETNNANAKKYICGDPWYRIMKLMIWTYKDECVVKHAGDKYLLFDQQGGIPRITACKDRCSVRFVYPDLIHFHVGYHDPRVIALYDS